MNRRTFRLPQAPRSGAGLLRQLVGVVVAQLAAVLAAVGAPLSVSLLRSVSVAIVLGLVTLPLKAEEALPDGIQRSLEGPDVVITAGKTRTVYEYRQNGRLRLVKIVPTFGRPYYLVPADQTRGYGDLDQANMLLPQWVIVEF